MTLQPVLINMPGEVYAPPKTSTERARFGEFATAAVRRYGPNGTFWTSCGCTKRPIRVWEVWNEPNLAPFWDLPNPAEYGALLSSTRSALRAADPGARVLFGGLAYPSSLSATRLEPNAFLRDTIQAVGARRFDAVALHNYRPDAARAVNTFIAGTVQTLKTYGGVTSNGAPRHQVWVNEFGRPTELHNPDTAADERAASDAAQRGWLDGFLGRLLPQASAWNLGPLMWYSLRDSHQPTASWLRQGRAAPRPTTPTPGQSCPGTPTRPAAASRTSSGFPRSADRELPGGRSMPRATPVTLGFDRSAPIRPEGGAPRWSIRSRRAIPALPRT